MRAKEVSRPYPSGRTAWAGRIQLAEKGTKRKQPGLLGLGDSARLQCEFQRLSLNLTLQLGYFGGGGGAGPQWGPGVLRAPVGEPGRSPAPPTCRDPGSGDPSEERNARAPGAYQSPERPGGFLLTSLSSGAAHHLPRALTDPLGSQPAKQNRRNYPPGWRLSRTAGFLSFPNFPPPVSFFPLALCVSLQVSLYCTDTLQSPTRSRDTTLPRSVPRGLKGEGGVRGAELGGSSRLPLHSR